MRKSGGVRPPWVPFAFFGKHISNHYLLRLAHEKMIFFLNMTMVQLLELSLRFNYTYFKCMIVEVSFTVLLFHTMNQNTYAIDRLSRSYDEKARNFTWNSHYLRSDIHFHAQMGIASIPAVSAYSIGSTGPSVFNRGGDEPVFTWHE